MSLIFMDDTSLPDLPTQPNREISPTNKPIQAYYSPEDSWRLDTMRAHAREDKPSPIWASIPLAQSIGVPKGQVYLILQSGSVKVVTWD